MRHRGAKRNREVGAVDARSLVRSEKSPTFAPAGGEGYPVHDARTNSSGSSTRQITQEEISFVFYYLRKKTGRQREKGHADSALLSAISATQCSRRSRLITQGLQPSSETTHSARHERDQEQHQRDEKHDFSDAYGGAGNAAKSENGGNQRYYQERNDETQHLRTPYTVTIRQLAS
jgi:hypothetical protein